MRAPTRRRLAALLCVPLIAGLGLANPTAAAARTPAVPALPAAIESLAPYVAQTACIPTVQAGTTLLARLLVKTYPGTTYGSVSACGTNGGVSEHYEGRAIDWMVSIRNAGQYASAKAFIGWLLATDRSGHTFAMARRLGVMYLIYNNRMWGSWSGQWEPYNNCAHQPQAGYDTACHRNHVHISLSWNGATGRTSFWFKQRVATDFGPCRPRDLNWAGPRLRINWIECPRYPKVAPAACVGDQGRAGHLLRGGDGSRFHRPRGERHPARRSAQRERQVRRRNPQRRDRLSARAPLAPERHRRRQHLAGVARCGQVTRGLDSRPATIALPIAASWSICSGLSRSMTCWRTMAT